MGDFNANILEHTLASFCTLFKLKNLFKEPTGHKNPDNPSCIDLFLTNCARRFYNMFYSMRIWNCFSQTSCDTSTIKI